MRVFNKTRIKRQSLAIERPDLLCEWDKTKNKELSPQVQTAGSNKKAHWCCKVCGKGWLTTIASRALSNTGCPWCFRPNENTCLQTTHPKVAAEWLAEANGTMTPKQVSQHCKKKYWWRCKVCKHVWEASVKNRAYYGTGCPKCGTKAAAKKQKENYRKKKTDK